METTEKPASRIRRVTGALAQASRPRSHAAWRRLAELGQTSGAIMAATVIASLIGYIFWVIVARSTTPSTVGRAAVVITSFTLVGTVASLGVRNVMVARLPAISGAAEWSDELSEGLVVAILTTLAVLAGVLVWFLLFSAGPAVGVLIFGAGAVMTAVAGVVDAVCVAERASRLLVAVAALSSGVRLALIALLLLGGPRWQWITAAWVLSLCFGSAVGLARLLARRKGSTLRLRRERSRLVSALPHYTLQHFIAISAFGATALLPLVVAVRLSATASGYFYASWRLGGVFMMISPAVSSALVAEGVRSRAQLGSVVRQSSVLIGLLLIPAGIALIIFGRPLLSLFGPGYAGHGYWLVVVLVLASVPDAITNVFVAVARVYERLHSAAALNAAMGVATLVIAWLWVPSIGIVAAGIGWLIAQTGGALAVPALGRRLRASE